MVVQTIKELQLWTTGAKVPYSSDLQIHQSINQSIDQSINQSNGLQIAVPFAAALLLKLHHPTPQKVALCCCSKHKGKSASSFYINIYSALVPLFSSKGRIGVVYTLPKECSCKAAMIRRPWLLSQG